MGVFANGPSPTTIDLPGIAAAMRPALEMWMTARLIFTDPARRERGQINPFTNERAAGPEPTVILDTGNNGAIIQPIRSPAKSDVGGQPNGILGIRFQVKLDPAPTEPLRGGLVVQVADGGNALIPATWRFSIEEGIDSSLMWDRIINATLITGGIGG